MTDLWWTYLDFLMNGDVTVLGYGNISNFLLSTSWYPLLLHIDNLLHDWGWLLFYYWLNTKPNMIAAQLHQLFWWNLLRTYAETMAHSINLKNRWNWTVASQVLCISLSIDHNLIYIHEDSVQIILTPFQIQSLALRGLLHHHETIRWNCSYGSYEHLWMLSDQ